MTRHPSVLVALTLACASTGCIYRSPGTLHPSSDEPLSELQLRLHGELRRDVQQLSVEIGPRNAARSLAAVHTAEAWIIDRLADSGISARRDEVDINIDKVANVEVSFPGTTLPDEIIVIGAHYDTVARSPGANDNASGVALLLAMAKRLADRPLDRTLRILFFVNEESPFSTGIQMGSKVYAERCRARGDEIVLMICVDSVGNYLREKNSQGRPLIARGVLPSTGNFVAFVTTREHTDLLDRVVAVFQDQSRFPSIGLATNSKDVYRSDHAPFLWQGYPAIAMSDTSEARDPHYHLPTDTADHLAYEDMARMAEGFIETVRELSSATTPLP